MPDGKLLPCLIEESEETQCLTDAQTEKVKISAKRDLSSNPTNEDLQAESRMLIGNSRFRPELLFHIFQELASRRWRR
jgi:hypothetical protein